MNRSGILILAIVAIIGISVFIFFIWNNPSSIFNGQTQTGTTGDNGISLQDPPGDLTFMIEAVATDLFVPWDMVFTSTDRILVTERSGSIRIIEDNTLLDQPLVTFDEVSSNAEEGLMGMTLHPQYEENRQVYVCYAYPKNGTLVDKVVRFTDGGNTINNQTIIIDDIPAARFHAGCRLRFGPDEKLYITTGDATDPDIAQDITSLGGKILRINDDGSIPNDNPFPNSPVYSYGHRNPQGIDWHPISGTLFSTEHGPSGFDGPQGGDEVNTIVPGGNYGWPVVSHEESQEGMIDPVLVFTPAMAPASAEFITSDTIPQLQNNLLFGALRGEGIVRIVFNPDDPDTIQSYGKIEGIDVGRIRTVVEGPDGYIYAMTSNRDGRANRVRDNDDKIYRIRPN